MSAQDNANRGSEIRSNFGSASPNVFPGAGSVQTTDQGMLQSNSNVNVGVASRLINKDATPSWNHLLVTNPSIHPHMVPMNGHPSDLHGGLSYTVLHQDTHSAENLPARHPAYSSVNFQVPFLNSQQFVYGNPMNPFIMFGASPSPLLNMPISSGQRFPLGFGNQAHQTSLIFQYPLHHLTGETAAPVRMASYAPQSSEQKGFITSTQTGTGGFCNVFSPARSSVITHPIVQSSPGQESEASVPRAPSENPPVTVVPAFVFDDPECDFPEDLSQGSREYLQNSTVVHDTHCSVPAAADVISPGGNEVQRTKQSIRDFSEMDLAASEWSTAEAAGSEDCWTFLDSFKRKRIEREHSFVKFRSLLAQSPRPYRACVDFSEARILPEDLLESLAVTARRAPAAESSEELPVEAINVDQGALRSFAKQLAGNLPDDSSTLTTDTAMKDLLRAVGLVEKEEETRVKESLFVRRIKRRSHAKSLKSAEVAGVTSLEISETARADLKKQLDQSIGILSVQMKKIKRKINTVKRLFRDEQHCGDSQVAVLLAELGRVLAE